MSAFGDWLDARTGYRALLHHALDEPVQGGARWAYVFGSGVLILFCLQAVTGIALAAYYSRDIASPQQGYLYASDSYRRVVGSTNSTQEQKLLATKQLEQARDGSGVRAR